MKSCRDELVVVFLFHQVFRSEWYRCCTHLLSSQADFPKLTKLHVHMRLWHCCSTLIIRLVHFWFISSQDLKRKKTLKIFFSMESSGLSRLPVYALKRHLKALHFKFSPVDSRPCKSLTFRNFIGWLQTLSKFSEVSSGFWFTQQRWTISKLDGCEVFLVL